MVLTTSTISGDQKLLVAMVFFPVITIDSDSSHDPDKWTE